MRDILNYQWDGLRTAWQNGLDGEAKRSAIVFVLIFLLAFGVCLALPDLRTLLVEQFISTLDIEGAVKEDGTLSFLALLSNNVRACTFTMVYGLIPFLFLPAMALGMNAMLLGVLAAWYVSEGLSILGYFAALLPHGIFELPALVLAFGMGLYVCGQMTARCRGVEGALHAWDCLVLIARMLLLVLLPLLIAAAFMEAFVTPLAASLFI